MRADIDKEQWSDASKQSVAYRSAKRFYQDIHYTCLRCRKPSVFPGEAQKVAFEIKNPSTTAAWAARRARASRRSSPHAAGNGRNAGRVDI